MKRSLTRAGPRLNKLKLAGAIQLITCIVCANAVSGLCQHFNQVAADAIAASSENSAVDLAASIQWSIPVDCHPIAMAHRQYASDNCSTRPFEAACEVAL
jgi:hypothetical protein